jgi:hypothetical protein
MVWARQLEASTEQDQGVLIWLIHLNCRLCLEGKYSTALRAALPKSCLMCSPGKYVSGIESVSEGNCTLCSPGTFLSGSAVSTCSTCSSFQTCRNGSKLSVCSSSFDGYCSPLICHSPVSLARKMRVSHVIIPLNF